MRHVSHLITALSAAAALTGSLTAQQTIVSPIQNTSVEGNTSNTYPLMSNLVPRYMAVHSDVGGTPKIIRQIGFRRNGGSASSAGTRTLDVEIWLGHSRDYDKVSYVFADNWIIPPTLVLPRRLVNIGPCPALPMTPEPFELFFPLTTPGIYVGSFSLAYEMFMYSNTNNGLSHVHDAETAPTTSGVANVATGLGCIPSGKWARMILTFQHRDTAGTYEFGGLVSLGPANAPTIVALGSSNPNLAVPGLCSSAQTNLLLILNAGLTDATGQIRENADLIPTPYPSALLSFVLPNTLAGATIYAQAHSIDLGRTDPILVCNSTGVRFTVPTPTPGVAVKSTRLYTSNLQGPTHPRAYPAGANVGCSVVTEFTY